MREVLPDLLWIGNAIEAREVSLVLQKGIEAIVDVAIEEKPIAFPRDIVYCRVPLNDGEGNRPEFLRMAVGLTMHLIREKCRALVCCGAGMSRSPAVAAMAIARLRGEPAEKVLLAIAERGPHDVSPTLWDELSRSFTDHPIPRR
ncbi:MAG TPA: dual specificity protein phosphatase [Pirellulaceae bacterium]|jgi:protein-tyrosine phosphatase